MTDRNRNDRLGLDDLALSRAERKALRDDANDSVTSDNGSWVPKPALASEIADREGTAEWAGDDEQVDLPGPDQYSFGATQNPVANSGVADYLLKFQGDGVVPDGPLDELPADEGSTGGGSEGAGVQAGSDYLLKFSHVAVEEIKSPRDVASGQITDAHDRYANQEVSYVQSDDGGDALLPFVEQQSLVEQEPLDTEREIGSYAALDGEIDI